jgi:hypothetical protein
MIRIIIFFVALVSTQICVAQGDSDSRNQLEKKIASLQQEQSLLRDKISYETSSMNRRIKEVEDNAGAGIGLFLSGILCALWAQYTRRSAWLWFFIGIFLAPIALVVLVWKNANGLTSGDLRYWTREP